MYQKQAEQKMLAQMHNIILCLTRDREQVRLYTNWQRYLKIYPTMIQSFILSTRSTANLIPLTCEDFSLNF